MNIRKKIGAILIALAMGVTSSSAFSIPIGGNEKEDLITVYEIEGADTIEDGVTKILQSVSEYGAQEYQEQVEDDVEQPFFWLLKPLDKSADNAVDIFAPDFTESIHMGACFEKYFHIYMQDGDSVEDAQKKAKEAIPDCLENNESPLEGQFASKVRQMVLCQPKHGQLLLAEGDTLHFAAAMPCHISIYEKDGKIYVSWRNVHEMAKQSDLGDDEVDLAEEIQEAMVEMLGDL
ncbi:MAG: DUF302 domain-containing protein [Epsilonproteobacteria bacterium]|nr:DUF302 domain-containing protein [Campylobacterota bacterium]